MKIGEREIRAMSDLLEIACDDMERFVAQDPNNRINMNNWVRPSHSGCEVCAAGAVLVMSIGWPRNKEMSNPNHHGISYEFSRAMFAIDALRKGAINVAYGEIADILPMDSSKVIAANDDNEIRAAVNCVGWLTPPRARIQAYRRIADRLRTYGL